MWWKITLFRILPLLVMTVASICAFSFQEPSIKYSIVDGHYAYWPEETETYYMWDDASKTSYQVHNRYELLRIMQNQGFTLISTYAHAGSNSGGYPRSKVTWIFKKN